MQGILCFEHQLILEMSEPYHFSYREYRMAKRVQSQKRN